MTRVERVIETGGFLMLHTQHPDPIIQAIARARLTDADMAAIDARVKNSINIMRGQAATVNIMAESAQVAAKQQQTLAALANQADKAKCVEQLKHGVERVIDEGWDWLKRPPATDDETLVKAGFNLQDWPEEQKQRAVVFFELKDIVGCSREAAEHAQKVFNEIEAEERVTWTQLPGWPEISGDVGLDVILFSTMEEDGFEIPIFINGQDIRGDIVELIKSNTQMLVAGGKHNLIDFVGKTGITPQPAIDERVDNITLSTGEPPEGWRGWRFGMMPDPVSTQKRVKQLTNPSWWSRRMSKIKMRTFERVGAARHVVRGHMKNDPGQQYCTSASVSFRKKRIKASAEFLQNTFLIGDNGNLLCLADVANTAESRWAWLMACANGMQAEMAAAGMTWSMLTLTAPGHMHPTPTKRDKSGNLAWETKGRPDALATQEYIKTGWARMRADLYAQDIFLVGFRCAEPHKDGTPHWHVLVWHRPGERKAILDAMDAQFKDQIWRIDRKTGKRKENKKRLVAGDDEKGSAVGYLIKYLTKHTGVAHGDDTKKKRKLQAIAERVDAWRSAWGIRSFQPFGLPKAARSTWNQLGRLKSRFEDGKLEKPAGAAGELLDAVFAGNFGRFCNLLGGFANHATPVMVENVLIKDDTREYKPTVGVRLDNARTTQSWSTPPKQNWRILEAADYEKDTSLNDKITKIIEYRNTKEAAKLAEITKITVNRNNPSGKPNHRKNWPAPVISTGNQNPFLDS